MLSEIVNFPFILYEKKDYKFNKNLYEKTILEKDHIEENNKK
jgi:hypothetical protein